MSELDILEEFITDRLGCLIIYHPENLGFVYYKITDDRCHIVELYVSEKARGVGVARWLIEKLKEFARRDACKYVTCSVVFNTATAEQALAAVLHDGFKVGEMSGNSIFMIKEL